MKKTTSAEPRSTQAIPQSKLTRAAVKFCEVYLQLPTQNRREVEHCLLKQEFLPARTDVYCNRGQMYYEPEVEEFCRVLAHVSSTTISSAWFDWALALSKTRPSRTACREAISDLLCRLVNAEYPEGRVVRVVA
jgi:hypothetical protein